MELLEIRKKKIEFEKNIEIAVRPAIEQFYKDTQIGIFGVEFQVSNINFLARDEKEASKLIHNVKVHIPF